MKRTGGPRLPLALQSTPPPHHQPTQEAASKFQSLQRVYAVLSDPSKRATYDRTGRLSDAEDLAGESFDELYTYFRAAYKAVTVDDLDAYEDTFRGSDAERAELLELYSRFSGDMKKVFAWLPCSDPARDTHRFAATVRAAVAAGDVKAFPKFDKWAATHVDGVPAPANPLAPRTDRGRPAGAPPSDVSALAVAMRGAAESRLAGVIASIEARTGKKGAKGKGARAAGGAPPAEPTDAEFEAAAARLAKKRKGVK